MRPYGTQKQLEKRRRRAIELLEKGYTLSATAKKLCCSAGSVFLWRQMYRQGGEEAMKAKPAPGRPQKLTPGQKRALTRILLKGPLSLGYHTDLWTQRRVAEVIKKRFGVEYHPNHLWRFLTALGWSCQKPEKRARERDEKAIQHWKRYEWPHIKKRGSSWCPSGLSWRERLPLGSQYQAYLGAAGTNSPPVCRRKLDKDIGYLRYQRLS